MKHDPTNLIAAVARAMGRMPNARELDDSLSMQKGCFILNSWGYGPQYEYDTFIRGPFSMDLASDLSEIGLIGADASTDVSDEDISVLRGIYARGAAYLEAYVVVLLIRDSNPDASRTLILKTALGIKPYLESEINEVSSILLA